MQRIKHFILFAMIAWGCQNSGPLQDESDPPQRIEKGDSTNYESQDLMTVDEFLNSPFSVYKDGIDQWIITDTIHPETFDTLTTEKFKESVFHYYNKEYIDATILDQELKITNEIHVGMSKADFKAAFEDFTISKNAPYVHETDYSIVMSCCSNIEMNDKWEFGFHNDTLEIIKFDHYIDTDIPFIREDVID